MSIDLACPTCGAQPGAMCHDESGATFESGLHFSRLTLAPSSGLSRAPVPDSFSIGGANIDAPIELPAGYATAANPRHLSESAEHFTPPHVVDAARAVLGDIDLDPASCELANLHVKAKRFHAWPDDDGFVQTWHGRVFLNPPGGKSDNLQRRVLPNCTKTGDCGLPIGHTHKNVESSQKKWWNKLAREWQDGRVAEAIFICFSIELFQTTQVNTPDGLVRPIDCTFCMPRNRIAYLKQGPDGELRPGTQPPHASAIIYLPPPYQADKIDLFASVFSKIGAVRR